VTSAVLYRGLNLKARTVYHSLLTAFLFIPLEFPARPKRLNPIISKGKISRLVSTDAQILHAAATRVQEGCQILFVLDSLYEYFLDTLYGVGTSHEG